MIVLKTLRWGNLFSYGDDNELNFTDARLTQLTGKNGHGKSSIALILELVLFNKNSKGIKKADILNRNNGAKFCWIQLLFSKDGIEYEIYTKIASTQTIKLLREGVDISGHTATTTFKLIQDILGCDHKTFCQIVYQSNYSSLEFLTATDTQRKAFLINLFSLTKYTEWGEIFKDLDKSLKAEIQVTTALLNEKTAWLDKHRELLNAQPIELLPVPDISNAVTSLTIKLQELQHTLSNISELNKEIQKNNQYKSILDSIDLTKLVPPLVAFSASLAEEFEAGLTAAKQAAFTASAEMLLINKQLDQAMRQTYKCSACGSTTMDPTVLEASRASLQNQLDEMRAKVKGLNEAVAAATQQVDSIKKLKADWDAYNSKLQQWELYHALFKDNIPTTFHDSAAIQAQINSIAQEISKLRRGVEDVEKKNAEYSKKNALLEVIKRQAEEVSEAIVELMDRLDAQKAKKSTLEVLVNTFSNTGLITYKIECLIKELEVFINEYLAELSDGRFQIEFVVEGDKLNVVVLDQTRAIEISALSSGELARVNISALLGIRKIIQAVSTVKFNLLILDETIDRLDSAWRERVVEILLEEDVNTLLVSHSFTHPLINKINVIKENNESRLEHG